MSRPPRETPASHALRGFLDFIASDDDEAASLRRAAAFVVVPMLNPDGCALEIIARTRWARI